MINNNDPDNIFYSPTTNENKGSIKGNKKLELIYREYVWSRVLLSSDVSHSKVDWLHDPVSELITSSHCTGTRS
jgi:hypothetical protein